MRIGVITQARMSSTRLPGKILLDAGGRTMLDHHLSRLGDTGLPIIVATTTNTGDDPVVSAAEAHGAQVHRGSEADVLGRFSGAAHAARLDVVVRVTSDCPLIAPEIVRRAVDRFVELDDDAAHVSNVLHRTYPRGFDVEVFSAAALHRAAHDARLPADREHVTPFLYSGRLPGVRLEAITRSVDASGYRVTLDTADDLSVLRELIQDHDAHTLDAEGIIAVLDRHPMLAARNADVVQKTLDDD